MNIFDFDLQLFTFTPGTTPGTESVNPINATTTSAMSPTMKTFYDTSLLENAREEMVFTQLGKKQAAKGKTVEWRKFNVFNKTTTPLSEGVIPSGQNFGMTSTTVTVDQYGDYTAISDRLEMESYDDVIFGASEEMGAAAGESYDTLTRNVISAGNSVIYAPNGNTAASARTDITNAHVLTGDMIAKAATWLKKHKAPKIDGYYVMVIHPSCAYDLRKDSAWLDAHKYVDVKPIFKGEIGELHGVRFIESNNVKVVLGGASNAAVYLNLVVGKDAFGVVDPQGEGMEMIVKDKSEAGGPLNQWSTLGYKFNHAAKILYQDRILRVECGSSLGANDSAN